MNSYDEKGRDPSFLLFRICTARQTVVKSLRGFGRFFIILTSDMRNTAFVVLALMIVGLAVCSYKAMKHDKSIKHSLALLLLALIPPIAGNLIIIASTSRLPALIGCYVYFLGMDLAVAYLLKFSLDYCNVKWNNKLAISVVYSLFTLDIIQYALNPFTGHAFDVRQITVGTAPYFQTVPYIGQTYHRIVVYGFFFASIIIFAVKARRTSRIYEEKYLMILLSMLVAGIWESYYIFSGTPVDTSMIGFGIFGFLVYYFALFYSPKVLVERMLASIASDLPDALFFFDGDRECVWANRQALELIGNESGNLENVGPMLAATFPKIKDIDIDREWKTDQVIGTGENARYYTVEKHIVTDDKGIFAGTFVDVTDDTETRRQLATERYNARHDSLTGLYNKEHLLKSIREMLRKNPDVPYHIVFLDVNEFKMVNDVFGKDFGDYALRCVADWIASDMTENCVYGRLGGDTFGVCQPVAEFDPDRINEALENFVVRKGDKEHHLLIHAGIYQIDDPDIDVSVMFDRARMALSKIKRVYSHIAFYNDSIRETMLWNQKISAEITAAIEERQLIPYFQPIIDNEGRVVGAEALSRWMHPEKGLLSPAAYIPEFEKNGRIIDLDKYMWRCACEQLAEWKTTRPEMFVSVNISPVDFYFMDVRLEINKLVREFGVEPSRLRLEITEAVMMSNIAEKIQMINWLKQDGFIVEMDDFGSGYSSLNMLKDMPVDLIKLDMAFLHDSMFNNKAKTILKSIVGLIDLLGMDSLVEGVETEEQFIMMKEMGCMYFQGYFFAKPLSLEEFEKYCDNAAA